MPSPRAVRLAVPRWLDTRLVLGVLLVVGSTALGATAVSAAGRDQPVWVARHDLVPGQRLAADDLRVGRARLAAHADRYLRADRPAPSGYVVARPVGEGELVPLAAVRTAAGASTRLVTVPVAVGHLPPRLAAADAVDVYVSAHRGSADPPADPELVLAAATVAGRDSTARGFAAGAASTVAVVLVVPVEKVAALVRAIERGTVDLVRVP